MSEEPQAIRRRRGDDPTPTGDGRCWVCPHVRPPVAKAHADPFCSTECAKVYHSPLARRLGLFPLPRVLIASSGDELTISARELSWIAEKAIPQAAGRAARAERQEDDE